MPPERRQRVGHKEKQRPDDYCRACMYRRSYLQRLKNRLRVWRAWNCRRCDTGTPQTPPQQPVKKIKERVLVDMFMFRRGLASASRQRSSPPPPRCPAGSRLFLNRNMRKVCERGPRAKPTPLVKGCAEVAGVKAASGKVVEEVSRRLRKRLVRTVETGTDPPPLFFYVEYLMRLCE